MVIKERELPLAHQWTILRYLLLKVPALLRLLFQLSLIGLDLPRADPDQDLLLADLDLVPAPLPNQRLTIGDILRYFRQPKPKQGQLLPEHPLLVSNDRIEDPVELL